MKSTPQFLPQPSPNPKLHHKTPKRKIPPLPLSPTTSTQKHQIQNYQISLHQNKKLWLTPEKLLTPQQILRQKRFKIDQRWIVDQFFNVNCQEGYFFQKNGVEGFLGVMKIVDKFMGKDRLHSDPITGKYKMDYYQFKYIQKCLPKPKLLTTQYLQSQKQKLHQYRLKSITNSSQQSISNRTMISQILNSSHNLYANKGISVDTKAYVYCPICLHVHTGSILAQSPDKKNHYIIKLKDLGSITIPQYHIATSLHSYRYYPPSPQQLKLNPTANYTIDLQAFAFVTQLLTLKQTFINYMKLYSNIVQEHRKKNKEIQGCLLQEYGWIGTNIKIIQIAIRYLVRFFDVRLIDGGKKVGGGGGNSKMPLIYLSNNYKKMERNISSQSQITERKYSSGVQKNRTTQNKIISTQCQDLKREELNKKKKIKLSPQKNKKLESDHDQSSSQRSPSASRSKSKKQKKQPKQEHKPNQKEN